MLCVCIYTRTHEYAHIYIHILTGPCTPACVCKLCAPRRSTPSYFLSTETWNEVDEGQSISIRSDNNLESRNGINYLESRNGLYRVQQRACACSLACHQLVSSLSHFLSLALAPTLHCRSLYCYIYVCLYTIYLVYTCVRACICVCVCVCVCFVCVKLVRRHQLSLAGAWLFTRYSILAGLAGTRVEGRNSHKSAMTK